MKKIKNITQIYGSRPSKGRLPFVQSTCRFLILGIVFLSISSLRTRNSKLETCLHDFHTSITEMRYNAKEKSFEISLRVFTDDLEKALSANNQNKKFIVDNNDRNDAFIEAYVKKHFVVTNSKNQKPAINYIGKEKEGDATWIYLEMPVNEGISGSKIQNNVLIDMFEDQTNIVNIFVQNQKKSYLFTVKNRVFVVEI
jgi:hypothetical protein